MTGAEPPLRAGGSAVGRSGDGAGDGAAPALVIFDLDGCLIDSEPIALDELARLLREAGVAMTPEAARDQFLGGSVREIAAWAAQCGGTMEPDAFIELWHRRLFARYRSELRPMPGAADLLAALGGADMPFRLATGGSVRRMNVSLEIAGLDRFFTGGRAHSADAVSAGKPAPDLFLLAAAAEGAPPERCLVVEDAPAGVTAAVRAGMSVVAFVGGNHLAATREAHASRLRDLGARAVFEDLTTLGQRLTGFASGSGREQRPPDDGQSRDRSDAG